MTYLWNQPDRFADEFAEGFVAANAAFVRRVTGGVARLRPVQSGNVALVIGGGSGHYPAFAGIVGEGLAAGAVLGNVFASPSAHQAYSVARSVERGGGVLFAYGNYSGDVLNFRQAEERLRGEGIPCASVAVTDDLSSAPVHERGRRRGIAGGLVVYKVAGAIADQGADLREVVRVANLANDRTRSIGVAFSGCVLPGATAPLFTVPVDRMAVGMGVHGEPAVEERGRCSADELAELLCARLLGEVPDGVVTRGARAALVLNGLGSVKYEELFVLYRAVAAILAATGVDVVEPDVGEFVTSFAMAGLSLSLCWLDDELERFWRAPAYSPAYRKGVFRTEGLTSSEAAPTARAPEAAVVECPPPAFDSSPTVGPASDASRAAGRLIVQAFSAARRAIDAAVEELGRYDAVAGDGDHGIGMQRGVGAAAEAARRAVDEGAGAGTVLLLAGDAWADRGGGTSGALWGVALRAAGASLGDAQAVTAAAAAVAIDRAAAELRRAGNAAVGDKTMLDAIVPFVEHFRMAVDRGLSLERAWTGAAGAAGAAAARTAELVANAGRARLHGEKSLGTPDPGAVSFALVVGALTGGTGEEGEYD